MPPRTHVLIVDDDAQARASLASQLARQGYRVTATTGDGAMRRTLERSRVDLVVLDAAPGDEQGVKMCRGLRASTDVPLIMMTKRADEIDRIVGLEMGADDFLVKPVHPRELLARIRNLLRRAAASGMPATANRGSIYRFGGWQLDVVARELADAGGRPRTLRSSDFRVLSSLLSHGNRVVARARLIELSRGRDASPFDRSVDVRISKLRQILGDDAREPRIIKTVHGEGYVIGVLVERA
jgi:two-component system OmpR family response regulator